MYGFMAEIVPPLQTKRPPGNRAAFSLRENSSNGGLNRQNFLAKSYESASGVSRKLLRNKYRVFSGLNKIRQKGPKRPVSGQSLPRE
jgi:hypothetical protein